MTLSSVELTRAIRVNATYQARDPLRWTDSLEALGLDPRAVNAISIAEAVAVYQTSNKLLVDGILGPKTQTLLLDAKPWTPPAGDEYVIVGGKPEKVNGLRVITMAEPGGLDLMKHSTKGYSRRRPGTTIDLFVLHHDGCYSSHDCFNVLVDRGVGMHFGLDFDGTVYQWVDAALVAWGQNHVNNRALGVEINNPEKVDRNGKHGQPTRPIEINDADTCGRPRQVLGFTPAQKVAAVQLTSELCRIFNIKCQLPAHSTRDRQPARPDGVSRALMPGGCIDRNTKQYAPGYFEGVCGHYHVIDDKNDPGQGLWQPLRDAGFALK